MIFQRPRKRGRTPHYCSEACKTKGISTSRRDKRLGKVVLTRDAGAAAVARSIADRAAFIVHLSRKGQPLKSLEHLTVLLQDVDDYKAYAVRQARDQKEPWEAIGQALHMTPKAAGRRFTEDHLRRRRVARGLRIRSQEPVIRLALESSLEALFARPTALQDQDGMDPADSTDGGSDTEDGAPPGGRGERQDTAQLSRALSHLHRCSGATLRAMAEAAEVSPSYVSRVLSGHKLPSWPVTKAMAEVCSGNPEDLRILWEAARGARPTPPRIRRDGGGLVAEAEAALRSTMRGLHLAAFGPPPADICRQADGRLSPREVAGLLEGQAPEPVPDWPVIDKVVDALRASADVVRPLWEHVQVARDPYWTPEYGASRSTLPAAFG